MNPKLRPHMRNYFRTVVPQFNDIDGDYVELGFGRGNTASFVAKGMSAGLMRKRTIWLFDSFQGFPEPTKEDSGKRNPKKGQWRIPITDAYRLAEKYPELDIRIVKGFFSDTVPHEYTGTGIGVLHLDCDLYESYRDGFKLLDQVNKGGLVMLDEYEEDRWPGATIAINEQFNREDLHFYAPESEHPKCYYIKG